MDQPTIFGRRFFPPIRRRRRAFTPAVRPLEGRRLLTASATMTQTATFPDLESYPNLSDQALLYFSATMGTLTEVDLVTSGSFQSQFSAENLGPTSNAITGTTTGDLAINVPTGAMPVAIPAVSESFNASAFDGTLDYAGTSGKTFATVTSSSAPQTTVLTSPAALAAFIGHFRIPISVSGHAVGSVASSQGDVASAFRTDSSATITVIYHYIPNLPSLEPPPATPSPSAGTGTGAAPTSATGTGSGSDFAPAPAVQPAASPNHAGRHGSWRTRVASHHFHRHGPKPVFLARDRATAIPLDHPHRSDPN
jgi:hypothetical protein